MNVYAVDVGDTYRVFFLVMFAGTGVAAAASWRWGWKGALAAGAAGLLLPPAVVMAAYANDLGGWSGPVVRDILGWVSLNWIPFGFLGGLLGLSCRRAAGLLRSRNG